MTRYVIFAKVDGTAEARYVIYDRDCGYVMSQTSYGDFSSAAMMSEETAREVYNRMLADKPQTMSDGTRFPPSDIHNGLGINNKRPEARGTLHMCPVLLGAPVSMTSIEGKIERPKGYIY